MKNIFYYVIVLSIITGLFVPLIQVLIPVIPFLIGFILFFNFMELEINWQKAFRKEILFMQVLSVVAMPLFAYHVLSIGLIPEFRVGLFLVSIAPSGVMILILTKYVPQKDYNLITGNFVASQINIIVFLPLMASWILGTTIELNTTKIFLQTAALIVLPYMLSILCKKFAGQIALAFIRRISSWIIPLLAFFIIASSISSAAEDLELNLSILQLSFFIFIIFILHGAAGYAGGYLFGDTAIRNSMYILGSSRNMQIMLAIAIINFPPLVAIAAVLGIIFHHLTNAIWMWMFKN